MSTPDNDSLPAFGRPGAIIQIQSIIYNNSPEDLERTIVALARSCELAGASNVVSKACVRLGDCGPLPAVSPRNLERLRAAARWPISSIDYTFFGANLGSARGHNNLAAQAEEGTNFLWIQNPDVVVSPRLFENVLQPFDRAGVGQVEAKQLPIEHPKDYDCQTGDTAWTTTACVMTPLEVFRALNGFDAESFFLYCDDVDFSYRVRELGFRLIFQPAAICFHDKRLGKEGNWLPTEAERRFSAEAGLMMAHKWSRPDLVSEILEFFGNSGEFYLEKAARDFLQRRAAGTLPSPRDADHHVAEFHGHEYASHRFAL